MKQIKENIETELIEKKSKFLTSLIHVKTIEDVNFHLKEIKKTHPNARHYCYAYILDNQNIQKSNDDGEPKGTAGVPILEVLKHHNLTNVLCVVTRYFGGVLLGKGGLIRAYQGGASSALKKASFYEEAFKSVYTISIPYSLYDSLKHYLTTKAVIVNETFSENIVLEFYFLKGNINKLLTKFANQIKLITERKELIKIDLQK